ncbi:uncharacterized protein [Montipora foliosa]|uniref:uncharacterized protein n=1 Tax=Montipora foliosa TaxID=591990 RepID=UPI0035F1900D
MLLRFPSRLWRRLFLFPVIFILFWYGIKQELSDQMSVLFPKEDTAGGKVLGEKWQKHDMSRLKGFNKVEAEDRTEQTGSAISKQLMKNSSVYGEPGCFDNPWRQELAQLFRAWVNISKHNNIGYILGCGSLLGAMRNGDLIPYHSDIDVLVDVNYFSILKRISVQRNFSSSDGKIRLVVQPQFDLDILPEERKRFDCKGQETTSMVDECSFQTPLGRLIKDDLHVDIFHYYDRVSTVDDPSDDKNKEYAKKDFYPFRPCNFMGLTASCPNNPWEILRVYYGNNLKPIYMCKNGNWVDQEAKFVLSVRFEGGVHIEETAFL